MSRDEVKLDLSRIVFIGRTYDEYLSMFNLTEQDISGRKILDCPAGACSFTAIANRRGAKVTAADIAYNHPVQDLADKGHLDIEHTMERVEKKPEIFVWNFFKSVADLKKTRIRAYSETIADMKTNSQNYVPAVLPHLPFSDQQFDLTLSAHFLFMYADRLDYGFHLQTLQELLRVTRDEIRIFPLVDLASNRYEHLDELTAEIERQGYTTEEIKVPYEFQKGANSLLRIRKR